MSSSSSEIQDGRAVVCKKYHMEGKTFLPETMSYRCLKCLDEELLVIIGDKIPQSINQDGGIDDTKGKSKFSLGGSRYPTRKLREGLLEEWYDNSRSHIKIDTNLVSGNRSGMYMEPFMDFEKTYSKKMRDNKKKERH